jgi:tetratricopeptide (TPR) repeat protein
MRSNKLPPLIFVLLLIACFSLAARLDPQYEARTQNRSGNALSLLLGDGRRIFANHFFVKADAYFHSGFYPTVFDNRESFQTPHMAADAGAMKEKNRGEETAFMGKPLDFIEEFSRHFMPSKHTHLDEGGPQGAGKAGADLGEGEGGEVREILPWLKISAELDPNRVETYLVTAYWLRRRMGKVDEAERFLREGLRANPGDSSILFELGRIYDEDRKDANRARNLWELAIKNLDEKQTPKTEQDDFILFQLTLYLSHLEEKEGNLAASLHWLERCRPLAPHPEEIDKQINDMRERIAASKPSGLLGARKH